VTGRTRSTAGFTLVEVLLAMSLMLVVFAATLSVFAVMERGNSRNQKLNDSQAQARNATDALAKRLRNLASPSDSSNTLDQQPLELANPQDLVFRTVRGDGAPTTGNPQNLERYRYCLGTDSRLYEQRHTWTAGAVPTTPPVLDTTSCPSPAWPVYPGSTTNFRVAAASVVNGDRPVFHYQGSPVPGTYTELTSVEPEDFPTAIALRTTLWIDPDPANAPEASTLSTRVFLRNQNRPPIASFTVAVLGRKITLNGSMSDDPEGNPLEFEWLDNGAPLVDQTGQPVGPSANAVYSFNAAPNSTHSFTLKVTDVGELTHTEGPRAVTCGATSCS
jgi:prepilin-type N-terminal cleavage/methylation domain-containing protein